MLTHEQKIARRSGIGASDAKKIMSGEWFALWQDKMGLVEPDEILSPWDASVRHALEPLIMDDYEVRNERKLIQRGAAVVSSQCSILRCTLDGFDPSLGPIDAKALNIWTNEPEQWCIDMYTGQMQHQMFVMDMPKSALHVSLGMKRPFSIFFERDDFFLTEYVERCKEFWRYVETKTEPPGAPAQFDPTPPVTLRTVDMSKDNAWVSNAKDWLENKAANKKFDDAAKALRAKITPDIGRAAGGGVVITRSKDNKLMLNPEPTEKNNGTV